jgi:hypothetical protein
MIQIEVSWVVTPYNTAVGYQSFGGPCCLRLHFTLKMEAANSSETLCRTAKLQLSRVLYLEEIVWMVLS